jgi:deoxyribodipyrimidine photo-lyase
MLDSVLVWFRRDLRDSDHAALAEAMRRARRVHCAFVFDREILDPLRMDSNWRADRRVEFIRASLLELDAALRLRGGGLIVRHSRAVDEIPRLAGELGVSAVFANRDYEPQAKTRDALVASALGQLGIAFESFKDQVIFDGAEVLTQAGRPYTVFTPYKNAWLKRLSDDDHAPHVTDRPTPGQWVATPLACGLPSLEALGFAPTDLQQPGIAAGMSGARALIGDFRGRLSRYREQRDFPGVKGVSYLSVHLRFGTVSLRELVALALAGGALRGDEGAATWLSELIWRDFYFMILDHFPQVAGSAFKPDYDAIEWEQGAPADALFAAWCEARTGYPLVDAAMRQLSATGYMHNRLRMVVASFLTKDLGLDWRRGEAWFARQLNDFDLAANNGGWQWAASSGCDAQPYFRIFNPVTQSERFDPDGRFIRRYLPELSAVPDRFIHAPWLMSPGEQAACGVVVGRDTPAPLVDHGQARLKTLARYAVVKRRVT